MRRLTLILAFMVSLLTGGEASARSVTPKMDSIAIAQMRQHMAEIRKERPTVALVLSGGGAKGAAHGGVIKRL